MLIVAIKMRNFFAAVSLIHNGANLSVTDIQNKYHHQSLFLMVALRCIMR